jgi:hypothetical protein
MLALSLVTGCGALGLQKPRPFNYEGSGTRKTWTKPNALAGGGALGVYV